MFPLFWCFCIVLFWCLLVVVWWLVVFVCAFVLIWWVGGNCWVGFKFRGFVVVGDFGVCTCAWMLDPDDFLMLWCCLGLVYLVSFVGVFAISDLVVWFVRLLLLLIWWFDLVAGCVTGLCDCLLFWVLVLMSCCDC